MSRPPYPTVTVPISLRFSDLDAYGHVNNAVFFTYLEEARIKLIGPHFQVEMGEETVFVVAHAACSYTLPVEYGVDLFVQMTVREMRRASFIVDYVITDADGITYATAETTLVAFDPVARRAASIPGWLDTALAEAAARWGTDPPRAADHSGADSEHPPPSR
ncbi:MAG: acyl-CoA thioesterase [Spirochaetaceae bacterium]